MPAAKTTVILENGLNRGSRCTVPADASETALSHAVGHANPRIDGAEPIPASLFCAKVNEKLTHLRNARRAIDRIAELTLKDLSNRDEYTSTPIEIREKIRNALQALTTSNLQTRFKPI
jgi:hypothetical protein